jgi:hypothetical protein
MKDKEVKIEETEVSHTLGGTIKYINLDGVGVGVVVSVDRLGTRLCVMNQESET